MVDKLLAKYGTSKNGHSIFAPSGSAGWLNCSAYLLVNARGGDSAGIEAAEGTVAHSVAEEWNKLGGKPEWLIGTKRTAEAGGNEYEFTIDDNMMNHVGRFVQWCAEVPGEHFYEQRVDLSELFPIPKQGGTADHYALEFEAQRLTITDLKYGTGIRVYAENNTQALLYAAGVFMEWDWIYGFKEIVIRICQPRLDVFETWTITRKQLLDFMVYVRHRALEAWNDNAPRSPSPKACQWCSGFERCPARLALFDQVVDATFDGELDDEVIGPVVYAEEDLHDHTGMLRNMDHAASKLNDPDHTINQLGLSALAYAYGYRRTFEDWFKRVGDLLLDEAEKGRHIPFFSLSEGRRSRKFKNPAEARDWALEQFPKLTQDKVSPRKIASVSQMEAAIRVATGKKPAEVTSLLADQVHVVRSKRSLVPMNDDRPDADDLLDDFDAEEDE